MRKNQIKWARDNNVLSFELQIGLNAYKGCVWPKLSYYWWSLETNGIIETRPAATENGSRSNLVHCLQKKVFKDLFEWAAWCKTGGTCHVETQSGTVACYYNEITWSICDDNQTLKFEGPDYLSNRMSCQKYVWANYKLI